MAFTLLGQILDIEWMLLRDEGRPSEELTLHDRKLLGQASTADAEQALRLWLEGRRRELDDRTLGIRASELISALHATLVVLSLAAGAVTAAALLRSPATREPTNVLHFLFATLLWPFLLLLGSLALFSLRGRLGRSVLLEDIFIRVLGALSRLAQSRSQPGWDLAREWRRLRRGARRYREIEAGTLISAAQWYPLSFHLGAAGTLLSSALFSDLAFAWSTTHDSLAPETLAAVFGAITAPWCLPLGVGCVSHELVQATQFSHFTGRYAAPEGAALSGAWWPVLAFCLLAYGILPRLAFGLGLSAFVRRRASRLSERVLELRGRLRAGVAINASRPQPAPERVDRVWNELASDELGSVLRERAGAAGAVQPCWVIAWRGAKLDEPQLRALCARLGLAELRHDAAGGSDFAHDAALLERAREGASAVVLVVEGWEAPDKATRRFVQALRENGPPDRPVFVCVLLARSDAAELALWRDRLHLLEDPNVYVQPVVVSNQRSLRREGLS